MISNFIFKLIQKFSSFKKSKFYNFLKSIIFPLIVKNISKIFNDNIDEKLIVMGAYSGGGFVDNTKYLFEFLCERSNYKLVWIAKLKEVRDNLREKGYNVVSMYSLEAIRLLRKAKFIFITHNYEDILPIKFSSKTKIILTWHGFPIKNIEINMRKNFIYNGWGDIFHLKLKNNDYVNFVLSQSGYNREVQILSSQLKITSDKVLQLGYPRNDILFRNDDDLCKKLKKKYNIPNNIQRVYLYAPTFRSSRIFTFPFSKSDLIKLNNVLKESQSLLITKPHMVMERIIFNDYDNIKLLNKGVDFQELLIISDVLISDYSGAWIDFLLTLKPILLFPYDLNRYSKEKGLNFDLEEIAPGPILYNANELIDALRNINIIDKNYKQKREIVRDKMMQFKDGQSTKRILNFLKINYN